MDDTPENCFQAWQDRTEETLKISLRHTPCDIPLHTGMPMDELTRTQQEELIGKLLSLRDDLRQQLDRIGESAKTVILDQQAFGRVSRMDALQQQGMAQAGKVQCEQQLRQVLRALADADSGDYGFCRNCDNPIGYERLKIQPGTPLCLDCQIKAEQT